jgi:hypothetical protein
MYCWGTSMVLWHVTCLEFVTLDFKPRQRWENLNSISFLGPIRTLSCHGKSISWNLRNSSSQRVTLKMYLTGAEPQLVGNLHCNFDKLLEVEYGLVWEGIVWLVLGLLATVTPSCDKLPFSKLFYVPDYSTSPLSHSQMVSAGWARPLTRARTKHAWTWNFPRVHVLCWSL